MELVRIVLAEVPRLLRDILHGSLATERDVELVGEASTLAGLTEIVQRREADVVILGLSESELPASYYALFEVDPLVRILTIADHGRMASLYELRASRMVLAEGSPQELLQIIQRQVRLGDSLWKRTAVS